MECGCGRSPTGQCIGWHKLSEEEYQEKLKEHEDKNKGEEQFLANFKTSAEFWVLTLCCLNLLGSD